MARHGIGQEELMIKYISEISPKMFEFINEVMESEAKEDRQAKLTITVKILPKIIDKMLPTLTDITTDGEKLNTYTDEQIAAIAARIKSAG